MSNNHHALSKEFVIMLCGGKLPEVKGCDWSVVRQFRLIDDRIVPYSDGVVVGPDLKLVAVPNQDNTDTALLKAIDG